MDEPASKKAKLDDLDSGDGIDELEQLEPLPQAHGSGGDMDSMSNMAPSTSQASVMGSGGSVPMQQMGAGMYGHPHQPQTSASGQQSVLQELLMNQSQASTMNSPRPPYSTAANANTFNTRSPMTSAANGQTMLSPPNAPINAGRLGPSPNAGQVAQQMRPPGPGQPGMYGGPDGMAMPQQYAQGMMNPQMRYGGYGGPAGQVAYPAGPGRGQQPQMRPMMPGPGMNGAQRGNMQQRPGMMMPGGPTMMRPMDPSQQYAPAGYQPRTDQYMPGPMNTYMGRGQPFPSGQMQPNPMMHQQQHPGMMMMDPNGQVNGPPHMVRGPPQAPMMGGPMPNGVPNQQHPGIAPQGGQVQPGPQAPQQPQRMPPQQQPPQAGPAPVGGAPGGQGVQGGAPPAPGQQDPEKRKLIQQQLVLLLHAHKCQQRERNGRDNVPNGGRPVSQPCNLPHCTTMKEVLQHMTTCNNGRQCNYPHCASSRQIIAHWKNCNREDCPVCKPLKSIQNSGPQNGLMDNPFVDGPIGDMNLILGAPGSVGPGSVDGALSVGPQSASAPTTSTSMGPFGSPNTNLSNPAVALLEGFVPNSNDPFRSPNPPNKIVGPSGQAVGGKDFSTMNFPPPEMPNTNKDWHMHVTKDLRNHLVGKLVKAIFPSPDPNAIHDQRIQDLIRYARKVEKEMFESANDREEYYHLLAEKIYKIQKELLEKKNSRIKPEGANAAPTSGDGGMSSDFNDLDTSAGGPPNRTASSVPLPLGAGQQSHVPSSNNAWINSQTSTAPSSNGEASARPNDSFGGVPSAGANSSVATQRAPITPKTEPMDSISNGPSSTPVSNGISHKPQDEGCSSTPGPSSGAQTPVPKMEPQTPTPAVPAAASSSTISPKKEAMPVVKREPTPPPSIDRVFDSNVLRQYLRPVWEKLDQQEDALPFRMPVDPKLLNIPDYFDIVTKPMDLMTICQKLDSGKYNNAWEFCEDMWQMFENAWLYNRKNSKVYKYSTKLSEFFVDMMDPVMRNMGYCCSRKLSFTPLALFCYGTAMCMIARDQPYMVYETNSSQFGVTVSERYTYCLKCFEALPAEGISLSENPNDTTNMAAKDKFKQMKNNVIDYEWFETCKYCHRKWHRVCAHHYQKVYSEGFICDTCRTEKKYVKPENKFTAKKLAHNKLSQYLEDRVNKFLKDKERNGQNHEVIIRTLCVQDKEVEVKPLMKAKYCRPGEFPEKFPYRTKAVFAFEVIDGVEVCFFGLHVQEYGSNCPAPNQRRVYIAYLDSVHFFQPRELRTDVYHEILLGYLDYVRKLGYTMAHIWACPPSEGDDYIFHCHPPEQKIPKPKRLQDWYRNMLVKGVEEGTVIEFKDIHKQARDDNLTTPTMLPYFEGDFWPNVIEDCIREANTEEERKKNEPKEDDDDDGDITQTIEGDKKKSSKNKKNNLKKNSKMNKKKQGSLTGNEVADKLYSQFEKHKEVFFTIRLVTQQQELSVRAQEIVDPDQLMPSEMMDGRDTFLTRARDEHWEFSSLRRAKYSTLCLCHALHETESNKEMTYTCNKCSNTNAKWHCNVCDDYDLCDTCKATERHEHPLEQIKSIVETTDQGSRYESIQRCIASLVHACQCRDANCRRMSCHKMKRVVQHTRMCKKRVNASCPVCKQLIALCCYHAKHCNRDSCTVPFCMNIRQKLAEQKRSIARRADMMMRRRMEGLQAGAGGAIASASASSQAGSSSGSSSQGHSGGGMSAGGAKDGNANAPNKMMNSSQMPQMQQMQNANRTASGGGFVQHSGMPNQQGQGGMGQPNSQQTPQQQHMFNAGGGAMSGMQGMNSMMQQQQVQHPAQQPVRQNSTNSLQQQMQQQQVQQGQRPPQQQQQQQSAAGAPPANMNPPPYRPPGAGGPMQNMGGVYGAMMQQQSHGNMQQMQHQQQQQMRMPGPTQPGRQQMPPGMGQPMPQVPGGQRPMNVQDQAMQVQVQRIQERLQNSNQDERAIVFQELKKTPHLFAAFIKTQPQPNMGGQGMPGVPGGANWGGMPAGNPHQAMYGGQNPGMQQGGRPMQPGGQYQMGWQQQQQFQQGRPQGSPAVGGAGQYGNAQAPGRSPMGMGQSPMMQPGQGMMQQQPQAQTDQGGQYR